MHILFGSGQDLDDGGGLLGSAGVVVFSHSFGFWFLVQELVVFDLVGGLLWWWSLLLDPGLWLLELVCLFWSGILVLDFWTLDPTSGAWGFGSRFQESF